jgi:hypothetical protein
VIVRSYPTLTMLPPSRLSGTPGIAPDRGGLHFCLHGTTADGPTDSNGMAFWTRPLAAGGSADGEMVVVMVGGTPAKPYLDIRFNSADMNGDLVVNSL